LLYNEFAIVLLDGELINHILSTRGET